ncbi:hypothetical protein Phum_PHUM496420 [Pediculus humanus corporis]|uniref:Uncharacterized protein n=1 Tax=Pediculus humanus subsp. corporis TaxID=121224 RepID=E0VX78_PEDHC|nr:uncharacterized protein Phum_PHUM496420 [Pediculus humanus corporis]EEB17984.1 hypothetical protein Phum_PHUM496420 [Pediculus humanus corporis]
MKGFILIIYLFLRVDLCRGVISEKNRAKIVENYILSANFDNDLPTNLQYESSKNVKHKINGGGGSGSGGDDVDDNSDRSGQNKNYYPIENVKSKNDDEYVIIDDAYVLKSKTLFGSLTGILGR